MTDKPFFNPFEDMSSFDIPPIPTELVRPIQNDFDFSKIGGFSSILGSVQETGQTFRNIFNSSVSPSVLANMASAGLQTQLGNLLSKSGFSKFFGTAGKTFNKTSYGYQDSEKKLNKSPNLEIDFNPLGLFSSILERIKDQINTSDEDAKDVENFYLVVNNARKKIWDLNARIWINTEKIRVIHQMINQQEQTLVLIFHSEEVFNNRTSIRDQIRSFLYTIEAYLIQSIEISKLVRNKEDYAASLALLKSQASEMSSLTKYRELNYVYEDLKLLRKTPESEFKPIP